MRFRGVQDNVQVNETYLTPRRISNHQNTYKNTSFFIPSSTMFCFFALKSDFKNGAWPDSRRTPRQSPSSSGCQPAALSPPPFLAHDVDPGVCREVRYRGLTGPPEKSGRQPPARRSAKSKGITALPVETRGGLPHHRGTAKD
jgi:hypothetical protein